MKRLMTLGILVTLVVLLLSVAATASAQQQGPCGDATFSIDPTSGLAGSTVTASGTGIADFAPYYIYWDSTSGTLLATGTANPSHDFSTTLTIPAGATVGDHLIILVATEPNENQIECPQTFTVTEPPTVEQNGYPPATTTTPVLPGTGAFLLPAAGLLVAGAAALIARRRR